MRGVCDVMYVCPDMIFIHRLAFLFSEELGCVSKSVFLSFEFLMTFQQHKIGISANYFSPFIFFVTAPQTKLWESNVLQVSVILFGGKEGEGSSRHWTWVPTPSPSYLGVCSIGWILVVLYRLGVNTSIVLLWETRSRRAWIQGIEHTPAHMIHLN